MPDFVLQDLSEPQTMTKSNATSFKKTLIKKMMYRKWNEFRKKKKCIFASVSPENMLIVKLTYDVQIFPAVQK